MLQKKITTGNVGGAAALFLDNVGMVVIDDACRFWVETDVTVERPWAELRTGQLSVTQVNAILDEVAFHSWGDLPKMNLGPPEVFDAPITIISDGINVITCDVGCHYPVVNAQVRTVSRKLDEIRARFLLEGVPVASGAVRIRVIDYRQTDPKFQPKPALLWPLAIDLESAAKSQEHEGIGASVPVLSPDDVSFLRRVRSDYLSGKLGVPFYHLVVPFGRTMNAGVVTTEFGIAMRDVVPFEQENGLLRVTW